MKKVKKLKDEFTRSDPKRKPRTDRVKKHSRLKHEQRSRKSIHQYLNEEE